MIQQEDIGHYIGCRDNEFYKVLSTLQCLLEQAKAEGRYGVYGESIEKLIEELKEKDGTNLSPWAVNLIITLLLDFVPDELKEKY